MAGCGPSGCAFVNGEREAIQRRTLRVLFVAQMFSGAGLGAGVAVGALLGEDMIGGRGYAGLPAALFTIGSALAAWYVGALSQRAGRRPGLSLGYGIGALGGAGTVIAAAIDSVPLLIISLFVYGSGTATNLQARYAGADLADPARQGRAISTVLVATTLGAVIGPNLVEVTGSFAAHLGINRLAGPFMLSTVAYAIGGLVVAIFLRPDPLLIARQTTSASDARADVSRLAPERSRAVRLAVLVLVTSQLVMLAVMTMTPVYMRDHGHPLSATGLVISLHIAAMFFPSLVTGVLVDRIGARRVMSLAAIVFAAAGSAAAAAPPQSTAALGVALVLLGLGWNLGVVGATALLTSSVPLDERAKTQGAADVALALSGAAGGFGSGVVVATSSYAVLSLAGGLVGLAILPILVALKPRGGGDSEVPLPQT